MKAVILAAGRGSRLGELTADRPKGMVEILGRPLLSWTLDTLKDVGITDIAIVGGYRHDMLPNDRASVIINPHWERSNMVASLLCAQQALSESDTIVSYSDILYHPSIIRSLLDADGDIALTYDRRWHELWRMRFSDPLADAETFDAHGGKVVDIGRKPSSLNDIRGQYMGLVRMTPHGWQQIERYLMGLAKDDVDRLDMTTLLRHLIKSKQTIAAVPVDGRWCEVDSSSDLAIYTERLGRTPEEPWAHDWR